MYYIILNKTNNKYYCNKSSNPQRSIEAHIRRANNPNSKSYNTPLHIALRTEGIDNFNFYQVPYYPEWVEKFKQYLD